MKKTKKGSKYDGHLTLQETSASFPYSIVLVHIVQSQRTWVQIKEFTTKALDKDKEYRIWLTGRNAANDKTTTDTIFSSSLKPANQTESIDGFLPLDFTATGSSAALALPDWLKNKTLTLSPDSISTTSDSISFSLASSSSVVIKDDGYFTTLTGGVSLKANEGIDADANKKVETIQSTGAIYKLFCYAEINSTRSVTTIQFTKGEGAVCNVDIFDSEITPEDPETKHVDLTEAAYRLKNVTISER